MIVRGAARFPALDLRGELRHRDLRLRVFDTRAARPLSELCFEHAGFEAFTHGFVT